MRILRAGSPVGPTRWHEPPRAAGCSSGLTVQGAPLRRAQQKPRDAFEARPADRERLTYRLLESAEPPPVARRGLPGPAPNLSTLWGESVYLTGSGSRLYRMDADASLHELAREQGELLSAPALSSEGDVAYLNQAGELVVRWPDGTERLRLPGPPADKPDWERVGFCPDGTVWATCKPEGDERHVRAFNPQGEALWDYALAAQDRLSLVHSKGLLLVKSEEGMRAVSPSSGDELWRADGTQGWASPGGTLYLGSEQRLTAYEPDGTMRWALPEPVSRVVFGPEGELHTLGKDEITLLRLSADGTTMARNQTATRIKEFTVSTTGVLCARLNDDRFLLIEAGMPGYFLSAPELPPASSGLRLTPSGVAFTGSRWGGSSDYKNEVATIDLSQALAPPSGSAGGTIEREGDSVVVGGVRVPVRRS